MSYITLPELADRPGVEELSQVATPARYPAVDPDLLQAMIDGAPLDQWTPEEIAICQEAGDVINDAIVQADGTIDGFLSRRGYPLPLQRVYPLVTGWSRAITRYLLHKDRRSLETNDPIVRDYKDAMRLLELTSQGKFSLGADDPLTPPDSGWPETAHPDRVFSMDSLRDY